MISETERLARVIDSFDGGDCIISGDDLKRIAALLRAGAQSHTALPDDAARWAWVRDHAFLVVGEDDNIALCATILHDGASERGSTPYLTKAERRNLLGEGMGKLPEGDAITRTVDAKLAAEKGGT